MAGSLDRLQNFAQSVKRDGFADVVLLGMGGSSLAPEVLRAVVGVAPGWPRLRMLDSTDPASVLAVSTEPKRTLYVLASKSGTTIEPNSLAAHFRHLLEEAHVSNWAAHFVAITDEGTELARRARAEHFRDVFINPSDIGGRYSALSFFGLVPAALMGQDIASLVSWGVAMLSTLDSDHDRTRNAAVALGLAIGAAARAGRDKLTLLLPQPLEPFGLWVEQLIAESTGKQGTGVIPVAGETPGNASSYGNDRVFISLRTADRLVADPPAGAPAGVIDFPEPLALGAEFVRWEIATAIAGTLLGINPFDEPNVQQAKDATRVLLDQFKAQGALPLAKPDQLAKGDVRMTLSAAARHQLGGRSADSILALVQPGDYVALLAYLGPDQPLADALNDFRKGVRKTVTAATTFGYGPRYLHSTGQLHKGGPNTGVFILMTATPRVDVPIPGEPFSFGTLELAQALGDFASLDTAGRRALHVHLPAPDGRLLRDTLNTLLQKSG